MQKTVTKHNHFYVTTPIYYVTARPHLGSLYSTVLADMLARYAQLRGKKSYFVTGTDEHGQKVANAAAQAGKNPKRFVDGFIPVYKEAWQQYEIAYQRFIRTTDVDHVHGAQHFIQQLIDTGAVYKDTYRGWYCTPCETFVTDKLVHDTPVGSIPACASCGRPTEQLEETSYFFRLSAYQDKLLSFYQENPHFVAPRERLNEVISFVKEGLKDLSISRTTVKWGIPFPGDPEHTLYVWAEALTNYITALGYGSADTSRMNEFWPADVQVLGKDIVRFHAVCWPALLMAAGLPVPKRLLVHGWIQIDKQKMSKSLGNAIDPVPLGNEYGVEEIRYFFARYLPVNQDAEFSIPALERAIESDLANDLGNLLNRMTLLATKYNVAELSYDAAQSDAAKTVHALLQATVHDFTHQWNDCQFHVALATVWNYIRHINSYFHSAQPWKVVKDDPQTFAQILGITAGSLHAVALMLWPVLPQKMAALLASLGVTLELGADQLADITATLAHQRYQLTVIPPLFNKPLTMQEKTMHEQAPKTDDVAHKEQTFITIDDVMKVELLVGTIQECVTVPDSDKLLKLTVDLGQAEPRTIFSGIKKWFAPSDLIGTQAVFVTNLQPRKMLGTFSEGMMMCAQDAEGKPWPVRPPAGVPNGTRLK